MWVTNYEGWKYTEIEEGLGRTQWACHALAPDGRFHTAIGYPSLNTYNNYIIVNARNRRRAENKVRKLIRKENRRMR